MAKRRVNRLAQGADAKVVEQFQPNPKQLYAMQFFVHPLVHRLLMDGGARCGKTLITIRAFVNTCLQFQGCRMLIVRKERKAAAASVWEQTLKPYLNKYVPSHLYSFYESDLECHFSNGSVIYVDGLDDKERVEKIRGREYVWIFVNEATDTTYEAVSVLIDRLAQVVPYPNSSNQHLKQLLVLDCNPKHPRHWVHTWCIDHIDPETGDPVPEDYVEPITGEYINLRFHRVNWSAFDNIVNLAPAFIERLKNLPRIKRDRMLKGKWVENEGMVYDEFDENIHVIDPFYIREEWIRYRGIDFGYRNPFACIWVAVDDDDRMYIYDCHYAVQKIVDEHAEIIKEKSGDETYEATVCDWEAEQRANLESKGIAVTPAVNRKHIRDGIDKVKARLKVDETGKPALFIVKVPSTQPVIDEFYAYVEKDKRDNRNQDEDPLDKDNHALGALRYVVDFHDTDTSPDIASNGRTDDEEFEKNF